MSHNILLEKTMKPLTVKSASTQKKIETVFSCYLYLTQYVHLIHHIFPFSYFSQNFSLQGLLDRSSLSHRLEFPLSKPENWEYLPVVKCIFLQCAMMWLI